MSDVGLSGGERRLSGEEWFVRRLAKRESRPREPPLAPQRPDRSGVARRPLQPPTPTQQLPRRQPQPVTLCNRRRASCSHCYASHRRASPTAVLRLWPDRCGGGGEQAGGVTAWRRSRTYRRKASLAALARRPWRGSGTGRRGSGPRSRRRQHGGAAGRRRKRKSRPWRSGGGGWADAHWTEDDGRKGRIQRRWRQGWRLSRSSAVAGSPPQPHGTKPPPGPRAASSRPANTSPARRRAAQSRPPW
ncbi:hypothetical protein BS78_10G134200 [Paspalum vaginatum]|nr:hypothetical protein BS78_10G134200 [Paspalum vaginatum]